MTIKELEESLKECLESADDFSRRSLKYAEVVGIACDVSDPKDVKKLSDFAVNEFGSINIWVSLLTLFIYTVSSLYSFLFSEYLTTVIIMKYDGILKGNLT